MGDRKEVGVYMNIQWPPSRKTVIRISIVIVTILIIFSVFAIIDRIRKESLNPGGTGGGYVPEGYVTLRGIDSSFRLSDNHYLAIQTALEKFLQKKEPKKNEYIVTADKKTIESTQIPNLYQYTSFDVTTSTGSKYRVVFFVDYITTYNTAIILENGVFSKEGVVYKNVDLLYKSGVPVYVVSGLMEGISHEFSPKNIEFKDISVSVRPDGSRNYIFSLVIDDTNFKAKGTFYYDLLKVGSIRLKDTISSKQYVIKTEEHVHD